MRGTRNTITALLLTGALVAAGCGDDDEGGEADTTTTAVTETTAAPETTEAAGDDGATTTTAEGGGEDVELTASFRGVTEDTIKIGIAMVDFQQLKDAGFLDFTFGDQELSYQAVIDEINENGGVLGRQLEPVYRVFFPVGAAEGEAMCVEFTEDEEVFAVLGLIPGLFPTVIDCIAGTHETIHVGHELTAELIDQYGGLLSTPDIVAERQFAALLEVLEEEGLLEGITVGVYGDQSTENRINDAVLPLLEEYGVNVVETGIVDTSSADSNQINAAAAVVAERFRSAGVDTVVAIGLTAPAQFPAIHGVLPDVQFITDRGSSLLDNAQANEDQSPWEGTLTLDGLGEDSGEQYEDPLMQECIANFEERQPDIPVMRPGDLGPDDPNVFAGLRDACNDLEVFVRAAEAAGPELTNESWVAGLESIGEFEMSAVPFASFGPGKYDAADGFRLVRFSSAVGDNGGLEPLGDIIDVTP